ncbi:hypothetical protein GCM10010250_55660 [Streptomyces althioticus]|nr:hypothetical protein GCM10010250_55660 [Streptomyces althioticus]GGT30038.1 hypothetical protein GCM10010243_03040 [Streptomyces matensis]
MRAVAGRERGRLSRGGPEIAGPAPPPREPAGSAATAGPRTPMGVDSYFTGRWYAAR